MHKNNAFASINSPVFKNNASNSVSLSTPKFDDDLPKFGSKMTRSNTLTLDKDQKKNLDKRRQSSLATRRTQNRRNLPIRINKVWQCFAQYVIDQMMEQQQIEKEQKESKQQIEKEPT